MSLGSNTKLDPHSVQMKYYYWFVLYKDIITCRWSTHDENYGFYVG
jgi:hypothetical protein